MDTVVSLRTLGFRRWYERTLIEAHLWLITCFLAMVLALALFETHNETLVQAQRLPLIVGAAFSAIGAWKSYRRYFRTLRCAEAVGQAATCPHCGAYGRFDIVTPCTDETADETRAIACCNKCRGNWRLSLQNHV
ncbi:MAG: hypothetical protein HYU78_08145 [Rhodocyclales bacterium]|nr:hypothetical protein [Rhodocyclales bacterium]